LRAIAGGAARAPLPAPEAVAPLPATNSPPAITSLAAIAELAAARREATLAAHIAQRLHLVRLEEGLVEIRPDADAPRDLAPRIAALLAEATGRRWTVAISAEQGAPTLAETAREEAARLRAGIEQEPLIRAILDAFPGATIEAIRDRAALPHPLDPETNEDDEA